MGIFKEDKAVTIITLVISMAALPSAKFNFSLSVEDLHQIVQNPHIYGLLLMIMV